MDLLNSLNNGWFLPTIAALELKIINLYQVLDNNSGFTLLHYASHYGNIKAIRYIFKNIGSEEFKDN
jgi:hypothetical protein